MNKIYVFILITMFIIVNVNVSNAQLNKNYNENLSDYQVVNIDVGRLKNSLQSAPLKGSTSMNRQSTVFVEFPMPKGEVQQFRVVEAPILSESLSSQRPDFKSYIAQGIDDPTATARFNITPEGLYAVIKGIDGISYVEKMDKSKSDDRYVTYFDHEILNAYGNGQCESDQLVDLNNLPQRSFFTNSCFQNGANLRTYEMVVTCSGEFYQLNGGTNAGAEAALLNRITQINAVYEPELAITFTIVEYLLNSNASTDPFSDPTNTTTSITEGENYINNNVSVGSWDIGHSFHEITFDANDPANDSWGGRAGVGVVCRSSKASGYTYLPNNFPTAVTVLLHEIGHMFSCYHTNYGCNTGNNCERYEPGRGSSIMSTSAGCDAGDFFASRTDYFGIGSLQSIMRFTSAGTLNSNNSSCTLGTASGWSDCSSTSATGNNMPTSNADANSIDGLTIPHSTPFMLSGTGSDADGTGSLTYNWEQYDTDYAGSDAPDDTGGSSTAPLFRSFPPSTSNERSCPQLTSVLAGNVTTGTGEVLPTGARTLTWRLTVRDNEAGGGGIACDEIALTVGTDGPFQITSQNTSTTWVAGATQTITWDVANTDGVAYTCPNIDILYSSDGGTTFGTTLASSVTNDGSETITVPGTVTSTGRIKIVCSGGTNVFFDINNIDIVIIVGCTPDAGTIANSTAVTASEGDPSLNLSLAAGNRITMNSGTLDSGDPDTGLNIESSTPGVCAYFGGNVPKYETMEFVVSDNTSYTFTPVGTGYTDVLNLFETSYTPFGGCTNWLNSSYNQDTGSGINFSQTLVPATTYVLISSGFNATNTLGTYTNTFTGTGSIYDIAGVPGVGYSYTYVIVNTGNGNIIAIDADSDLSNTGTFPQGNYEVYGLSYIIGENLSGYIGGLYTTLQTDIGNSTICGDLSSNSVPVTITGTVPIELIDFDGVLNKSEIVLSWKTASEQNNDYFLIERSLDGRTFEALGTVNGNGTTTEAQSYNLLDTKPAIGTNYYRLTQFDYNGAYEVFQEIVAVDYKGEEQLTLRPNPIRSGALQIAYQSSQAGDIEVSVFNTVGQQMELQQFAGNADLNQFEINIDNLSPGVYLLQLRHGNQTFSRRFVKAQ